MKTIAVCLISATLCGCASTYRPLVDPKPGQTMARYESDLAECRRFAEQVAGPGTGAAVGAVAGSILSLAISAIFGNTGRALGQAAAAGAVLGGVGGAAHGGESETQVIARCMAGRGWRVLQ
jgi:outer membrane lipoprotein SlyB